MAARYWVGGAGNWSSTTKWSTSSGGASGASVPTSVDDVIFDANSGGKFTATVDTAQTVNSITITPSSGAGVLQIALSARLTTGNLTTTGTAGNNRIWFRGTTYGIAFDFVVNGTVSISDCDFRDVYVVGTAAPISGTRIGNRGGCRGITFDAPKTVYWATAAGGNWSGTNWAATSGGAVSTDNFPLAQDTAVIDNTGLNTSATVTVDTLMTSTSLAMSGVDMSTRTNAMTLATGTVAPIVFGDWKNGSGTTLSGTGVLTFGGRNTQTITSAGRAFTQPITIDSYGGTVQLADAITIGSARTFTVTNGTFDTKNYNVTANVFSSSNSNVRTINFGSSTITVTLAGNAFDFSTSTNLTFNAGTSQINVTSLGSLNGGGRTFYNASFTSTTTGSSSVSGSNTFNNLTVTPPASAGLMQFTFLANQTINGTLTCAGASAVRRIFLRSGTLGTQRDLTVGTLVADDCDFRDIEILGAAIGTSPTRAGDCGGNNNITFPAPKTVYWNLAGTQSWSATAWATSSGGTPSANNFPLAQDTAVFDNTGSAGTVNINSTWNIGTINASGRTTGMTLSPSSGSPVIHGNFSLGTGVTTGSQVNAYIFSGRGTSTITSAGVTFNNPITVDCVTGTVQLADALTLAATRTLTLTSGMFDAVSYNVTTGLFTNNATTTTLKMGSGTWTLSGTGTVWSISSVPAAFYKGTANIVLSDTSTTARTFAGNGLSYNKLTIGGTTGTSTLTITGNNQFTELSSTKTVAHTIALGTTTQTLGAWTVTGTAGNVVTVSGTGTINIVGPAVSGVDYLAMGTTALSNTSPGEFYAGVNSTGTGSGITLTAAPSPRTLYWVGGTGNWSSTTKWSTSSGGASGAAIPTSLDDVVFNSASNATAYSATIDPTQARCKSLTISGPASGNLTLAGTGGLACHGNVSFPATNIVVSFAGNITLSSSSTGLTFTTNGQTINSLMEINGVGCSWALGSALTLGTGLGVTVTNGTFSTSASNYSLNASNSGGITVQGGTLTLNASTITTGNFTYTSGTLNSGTSTINCASTSPTFAGGGQTYYNVSFTNTGLSAPTITGENAFNNLSFTGRTAAGVANVSFSANQTINSTLTFSAGADAARRLFAQSDTFGTTRTLTCAAFSGTDADFRDITIAGAAAPVSGTRLGDCKGNSGITFDAPKTVYWNLAAGGNWSTTGWATTGGGTPAANNFPLAQDTAIFQSTGLNSSATVTVNANWSIGTIDMSARTSNTMTLATGTTTPTIYGNWINGTGTTLTGTGQMTFAGRGSQTITSAGRTFTQILAIDAVSGSVTLQDALTTDRTITSALIITSGTFDANGYNVTLTGAASGVNTSNSNTRTVAIGSGTWTIAGTGGWNAATSTNLTVTGTGTISLTSASAKTFAGGGIAYTNITLNQGGAGALAITGNNTFKDITNTYKSLGATTINMGTTTQTVTQWTGAGQVGNILTVQGTSAASPATLILSGATKPNVDYLTITGVRAYSLDTTWYAGANSTNNGSLGWYFESGAVAITASVSETASGADVVQVAASIFNPRIAETATGADSILSRVVFRGNINETGTASDAIQAFRAFLAQVLESSTGSDSISAAQGFASAFSDTVAGTDSVSAKHTAQASVSETASLTDVVNGGLLFLGQISESATAADVLAAAKVYFAAIADGASIADAVAVAASTFNATAADTATGTDSVLAKATFRSSTTDTATGTDTVSPKYTSNPVISESGTGSDAVAAKQVFATRILESGTGTDSILVAPSTFNAVALAVATAVDAPRANAVLNSQVVNTATIQDSLIGGFLWNLINDEQTPNWQLLSDAQSPNWTGLDDSQDPNWQNINTLN